MCHTIHLSSSFLIRDEIKKKSMYGVYSICASRHKISAAEGEKSCIKGAWVSNSQKPVSLSVYEARVDDVLIHSRTTGIYFHTR